MHCPARTFARSLIAAATITLAGFAPAAAATASPFNTLSGVWSGRGEVRLGGGRSERLVCRAYYNNKSAGTQMTLGIRCASTSYKIELRSSLSYKAGRITGTWEERGFNTNGTLAGKATGNTIKLSLGGNISGSMTVTFGRSNQRVSILNIGGSGTGVFLNLTRK